MRIALRELLRRPSRFAFVGSALALLSVLLLLLGGLLDGLYLGSTGAIRAQDAPVFVFSADAQDSFLRSRITPELRDEVEAVDGVSGTAGLGVTLEAGRRQAAGTDAELLDLAVVGYEAATAALPAPPGPGEGWADASLRAAGVTEGDTVLVGASQIPVRVGGFVDDTNYLLQSSLWVDAGTWRSIQSASRPDATVADGVFQVLLVDGDTPAATLADRIDAATTVDGTATTSSLTRDEAVLSLPGTKEQNSTFTALIGTTFFVVALITALFFVLLTVERTALFAAMKALGVGSRRLIGWSVAQSTVVATVAFATGGALALGLAAVVPDQIPLLLAPGRAVATFAILLVTAAIGSLLPLRRIVRIDPANAIS